MSGRARLDEGTRALIAVVATDAEPLFIPTPAAIQCRLDRTISSWRRWADLLTYDGPWNLEVRRSALALKTLLAEYSGAIAAAATTSLPERIGGPKNWDYRYAWTRDTSFTVDALINLGLHEEVHGAVSWLLGAICDNGGDLHVFYSLDGTIADREATLGIPGWRHSQPVRSGNSASGQMQLGTYGDLFDTISRYCDEGHEIDPATGRMLADMADRCCDRWRYRDSGIWELEACRHYTISKIGCWVALDRAVHLAESGQLPGPHVERWRSGADEIRAWVNEHCWSDTKEAYTFYAGTDDLDAAVLLAGRTGFERGPRLDLDHRRHRLRAGVWTAPLPLHRHGQGRGSLRYLQLLDGRCSRQDRADRARLATSWTAPSPWPTMSGCSPNRSTPRPVPSWATCPKASLTSR